MVYRCVAILVFCGFLFSTGCTPNYYTYINKNLELSGWVTENGKSFTRLSIGNDTIPCYESCPDIWLEFDSNDIVRLKDITPSLLESKDAVGDMGSGKTRVEYQIPGKNWDTFHFVTVENKLHSVSMQPGCIWNADRTRRYKFPMGFEDVKELFGAPEKMIGANPL